MHANDPSLVTGFEPGRVLRPGRLEGFLARYTATLVLFKSHDTRHVCNLESRWRRCSAFTYFMCKTTHNLTMLHGCSGLWCPHISIHPLHFRLASHFSLSRALLRLPLKELLSSVANTASNLFQPPLPSLPGPMEINAFKNPFLSWKHMLSWEQEQEYSQQRKFVLSFCFFLEGMQGGIWQQSYNRWINEQVKNEKQDGTPDKILVERRSESYCVLPSVADESAAWVSHDWCFE